VLKVRIKASKTDPFCLGVDVFLGRMQKSLHPVAAVLCYLQQRGPEAWPLFKFADGRPLTRPRFATRIREALCQAGVPFEKYSSHSFRIGAATTTARQGIAETTSKCWDAEKVIPTNYISGHPINNRPLFQRD